MMWFIEKLFDLLTFPVKFFWKNFEQYKETKSVGKLILLFAISLAGLICCGQAFL